MKRLLQLLVCMGAFIGMAQSAAADDNPRHYSIGDLDVVAIRDADITMEKKLLPNLEKFPELAGVFADGPAPAVAQTFYFKSGEHKVLVDAGWGQDFKTKGKTVALLREIGIAPEDITDILLTHMDIDHIGGLLSKGKPVYPNATLWIAKPEYDAWMNNTVTSRPQQSIDLARQVVAAYKDKVRQCNYGDAILPCVRSVDASGHTPGHTAYDIVSGKDKMTIAGDILHIAAVQLPHPELSTTYDMDQAKAALTREHFLERASREKSVFAGMHFPMIGNVDKLANGGFVVIR